MMRTEVLHQGTASRRYTPGYARSQLPGQQLGTKGPRAPGGHHVEQEAALCPCSKELLHFLGGIRRNVPEGEGG